jgi:hypothetical protein
VVEVAKAFPVRVIPSSGKGIGVVKIRRRAALVPNVFLIRPWNRRTNKGSVCEALEVLTQKIKWSSS